jgi:putative DNA modification/repair radical SAM protein
MASTGIMIVDKLALLADAAKYDASCSTSGSDRSANANGIGSAAKAGICHSWSNDGRCVALLKVLLSNACAYDCAYCRNRKSNDIPRATFSKEELVSLVMDFYRRNYIEGLFLSSGVLGSPDATMERMIAVVRALRQDEKYNGYIHMKTIPGASHELIAQAGKWVDRLSVNIELPSNDSLTHLAPDKKKEHIFGSMYSIKKEREEFAAGETKLLYGASALPAAPSYEPQRLERQKPVKSFGGQPAKVVSTPLFVPAGQTTQMVIGASGESDRQILTLMQNLYSKFDLKRVYYSAYVPVNDDPRIPLRAVPLRREHRLYQADWLFRFYQFDAQEILDEQSPFLDDSLDPKCAWALRHPEYFPVEVMKAPLAVLLRVPGIGPASARRIIAARRHASLKLEDLSKLGIVMKRARFFLTAAGKSFGVPGSNWDFLRPALSDGGGPHQKSGQIEFDFGCKPVTLIAPINSIQLNQVQDFY